MYQLYHNKSEIIIKISKVKKVFNHVKITDEIKCYNDNYFLCSDRSKLKIKALELKNEWVIEAKILMEKYKNINI